MRQRLSQMAASGQSVWCSQITTTYKMWQQVATSRTEHPTSAGTNCWDLVDHLSSSHARFAPGGPPGRMAHHDLFWSSHKAMVNCYGSTRRVERVRAGRQAVDRAGCGRAGFRRLAGAWPGPTVSAQPPGRRRKGGRNDPYRGGQAARVGRLRRDARPLNALGCSTRRGARWTGAAVRSAVSGSNVGDFRRGHPGWAGRPDRTAARARRPSLAVSAVAGPADLSVQGACFWRRRGQDRAQLRLYGTQVGVRVCAGAGRAAQAGCAGGGGPPAGGAAVAPAGKVGPQAPEPGLRPREKSGIGDCGNLGGRGSPSPRHPHPRPAACRQRLAYARAWPINVKKTSSR